MTVVNVYKPRDVWPTIKYTKMLTKKNLRVIRVGQPNWRGLGKFLTHG